MEAGLAPRVVDQMETAGAHEIPAVRTVGDGSARGLAVGEDKGCHHDGLLESCVVTTASARRFFCVVTSRHTTQRRFVWEKALVDLIY